MLTLGYDGDNHYPLTVTDGLGQVTRLAYQGGRLQSITDTAGRKTTYAYTTDGKLESITDPQGGKTSFAYDGAGYLTAVTSPEAQKMALQYGSATPRTGLLKLTRATQYAGSTEGGRWQYAYGAGQTTITDRDGGSVTSVFDNVGRAVTKYDRDGNVVSTKYAEGASSTIVGNVTTKQVDTKVKKQFSEGYVENLLQNSSAEKETIWKPSQWGKGPVTATTGFVTDCVHSGNRALRVQVSATTVDRIGRLQQLSTLKVGETYTFSAYIKTQNVAGEGGAMLYVICGDPSRVFESRVVTGTEDWQRMSVTFTVPANTREVRVHGGLWKSTGTLWMDDCQLEKGSVANRYNYVQNGSFEFTSGGQPTEWITGAAQTLQGIGQVVNHVTKTNVLREDNIVRTAVKDVGRAIGGNTGAKVAGGLYDAAVVAADVYAGKVGLQPAGKVKTSDLVPDPTNPMTDEGINYWTKTLSQNGIKGYNSLPNAYGAVEPICVQRGTMMIANGHHRVAVLREYGVEMIKVFWVP